MTAIEARRRGLCTVRIDLNQDDAKQQLSLFFKIFDSLLTAAVEQEAFGGAEGKTYETYFDTVNTFQISGC